MRLLQQRVSTQVRACMLWCMGTAFGKVCLCGNRLSFFDNRLMAYLNCHLCSPWAYAVCVVPFVCLFRPSSTPAVRYVLVSGYDASTNVPICCGPVCPSKLLTLLLLHALLLHCRWDREPECAAAAGPGHILCAARIHPDAGVGPLPESE